MRETRYLNSEKKSISDKKYREANKEKIREVQKRYREENKEKIKMNKRRYHEDNAAAIIKKSSEWYFKNKKLKQEYDKEYRKRTSSKLKERFITRYYEEPIFRLRDNIRGLILQSFKKNGYSKKSKTMEIIGCSFDELKRHLESKFKEGMSWDNRGEWHIDHIIPLALGATEEEVIALNHYTNLQPLWAKDNLSKGAAHCEIQANKFFSVMGCRQ
jgi:hypothetical protein